MGKSTASTPRAPVCFYCDEPEGTRRAFVGYSGGLFHRACLAEFRRGMQGKAKRERVELGDPDQANETVNRLLDARSLREIVGVLRGRGWDDRMITEYLTESRDLIPLLRALDNFEDRVRRVLGAATA